MANQLSIVQAVLLYKQKRVRYNLLLSGVYVQVANGGEILNLNGASGVYDSDQYWGYQGPKWGTVEQPPAGYPAQIVPGVDSLHPILKVFSAVGVELAAGAYPAAILAELNAFIEFWGADFK